MQKLFFHNFIKNNGIKTETGIKQWGKAMLENQKLGSTCN